MNYLKLYESRNRNVMNSMSNMINRITRPFGFMVQRTDTKSLYEHTMDSALQRCRELHKIIPATIIDVGAAEGKWTLLALNEWAKSNYVLFEPLLEREGDLTELKKKYNNIFIINKGAGSEKRRLSFLLQMIWMEAVWQIMELMPTKEKLT